MRLVWFASLALLAGACSNGPAADSGVFPFDAGFFDDLGRADDGPADGGELSDAGEAADLGLHPDAEPPDLGLHPDAEPDDLGLYPDAEPADLGLLPDAGFFPDADPVDLGVHPDGAERDAEPLDFGRPDVGDDAGLVALPDSGTPFVPDAGPVSCAGYGFEACTACLGVNCCAPLWDCGDDPICSANYTGCFGNCLFNGYPGVFCAACFQSPTGAVLSGCLSSRCALDCQ